VKNNSEDCSSNNEVHEGYIYDTPLQFHFYGSNDALFDQETSFRVPSVLAF